MASTIDRAEQAIRAATPTARWIFLEPDIRRTGGAPGTAAPGWDPRVLPVADADFPDPAPPAPTT